MNRITLQIPNSLATKAQSVALQTKRPVEDVLVEWLNNAAEKVSLNTLGDDQIIALTNHVMDADQQAKLSTLLARKREEALIPVEKQTLDALMAIYRQGLVQKAEALKIAVERGLIPPLS
ncbi:MAG: hypothetical protein GY943_32165 [Chloroflexi bacterium]|nr:hypothetical protein [Chloroflexota bacterium]